MARRRQIDFLRSRLFAQTRGESFVELSNCSKSSTGLQSTMVLAAVRGNHARGESSLSGRRRVMLLATGRPPHRCAPIGCSGGGLCPRERTGTRLLLTRFCYNWPNKRCAPGDNGENTCTRAAPPDRTPGGVRSCADPTLTLRRPNGRANPRAAARLSNSISIATGASAVFLPVPEQCALQRGRNGANDEIIDIIYRAHAIQQHSATV